MTFEDLRLSEPLLRAVRAAGYRTPTPIQSNAIPIVLAGRDVLGCAQTGTGKTAAFALPVLQRLGERTAPGVGAASERTTLVHGRINGRSSERPTRYAKRHGENQSSQRRTSAVSSGRIRALVLCPTRELAQQIHDSFRTYGRHTRVRQSVVFGGVNQNPQARALRAGVDVLIATPGRLLDLMGQGLASLAGVEVLILDEADRMLDMGFLPDLRRILTHVPNQRQTLLFSATMPPPIRKLADDILNNPVPVHVSRVSSPTPLVSHWVYQIEKPQKPTLLTRLLNNMPHSRALVFTRTKYGADKVVRHLVKAGVHAAALHGNKSQNQRTRALADFRSGKTAVLIATDIAARGLDVEDISHVINYDLTPEPETYVHRIGRTGRAGATGIAVSFCTSQEHGDLRAIERFLGVPLQPASDSLEDGQTPPSPSRTIAPRTLEPRTLQPRPRRDRPGRSPSRRSHRRRSSNLAVAS